MADRLHWEVKDGRAVLWRTDAADRDWWEWGAEVGVDCVYVRENSFPLPILARLLASTDEGRKAMREELRLEPRNARPVHADVTVADGMMRVTTDDPRECVIVETEFGADLAVSALRAVGWTCCPPGSEERWFVAESGFVWLGDYSSRQEAEESVMMTDRHTGERISGRRAVRFVREPEPAKEVDRG